MTDRSGPIFPRSENAHGVYVDSIPMQFPHAIRPSSPTYRWSGFHGASGLRRVFSFRPGTTPDATQQGRCSRAISREG